MRVYRFAALLVALSSVHASAALSESAKIEALLKHVESLPKAIFNRNGKDYQAKDAATFLRRKWQSESKTIKTAADFIDKIASRSSTSGRPYTLRLESGAAQEVGPYLQRQLRKLEGEPAK